jgi:hypothetical protein
VEHPRPRACLCVRHRPRRGAAAAAGDAYLLRPRHAQAWRARTVRRSHRLGCDVCQKASRKPVHRQQHEPADRLSAQRADGRDVQRRLQPPCRGVSGDCGPNYGKPITFRYRCIACGVREYVTDTKTFRAALGVDGPLFGSFDYRVGGSYARSEVLIGARLGLPLPRCLPNRGSPRPRRAAARSSAAPIPVRPSRRAPPRRASSACSTAASQPLLRQPKR